MALSFWLAGRGCARPDLDLAEMLNICEFGKGSNANEHTFPEKGKQTFDFSMVKR